jgi:hypothetical protein
MSSSRRSGCIIGSTLVTVMLQTCWRSAGSRPAVNRLGCGAINCPHVYPTITARAPRLRRCVFPRLGLRRNSRQAAVPVASGRAGWRSRRCLLAGTQRWEAAKRFITRWLKRHGDEPHKIVTDKLRGYGVALRELIPEAVHDTHQYANHRAELSHQPTRVRERGMRRFKSRRQAQRFLDVRATVYNLSNLRRHLTAARHHREFRQPAFVSWAQSVAA